MPLIRGGRVPLALEHVAQMSTAVAANNLRPLHAEHLVLMPRHSTRDGVEESRPAATGLEFVGCFVEGRLAAGAGVDAIAGGGGVMLIVFADVRSLSSLFAEDTKLLCEVESAPKERWSGAVSGASWKIRG